MAAPEHFIRFRGQTRGTTIGLGLGALVFALGLRFAISKSVAPDPMGPIESWGLLALAAVCFVGVLRGVWHAFAPRVEVTLTPYPLVMGRPVRVAWEFTSERGRVQNLRVEARFLGARYDRHGHPVHAPKRVRLVAVREDSARSGSREVELPTDLVATSPTRSSNKTWGKWSLEVRARVEGAPSVFESYPVRITRG